jgi:hypothetical protein
MDYQKHLEKLVADIRNKVFEEEELKESFKVINKNYEKIQKQLIELTNAMNFSSKIETLQIIDNAQFMKLMGISQKTAQTWRDSGLVSYTQINNKIYYKILDVKELIEVNQHKSSKM